MFPDIMRIKEGIWKVFYNGRIYVMMNSGEVWNLHYKDATNPILASDDMPESVIEWLMCNAKN